MVLRKQNLSLAGVCVYIGMESIGSMKNCVARVLVPQDEK